MRTVDWVVTLIAGAAVGRLWKAYDTENAVRRAFNNGYEQASEDYLGDSEWDDDDGEDYIVGLTYKRLPEPPKSLGPGTDEGICDEDYKTTLKELFGEED